MQKVHRLSLIRTISGNEVGQVQLIDVVNIQTVEQLVEAAGLRTFSVVHKVTQETQDYLSMHEVANLELRDHLNDTLGLIEISQLIFICVIQSKRVGPYEEHLPHVLLYSDSALLVDLEELGDVVRLV